MDLQRAYNIVCLMVGGADKLEELANEVKLPEERQETCQGISATRHGPGSGR